MKMKSLFFALNIAVISFAQIYSAPPASTEPEFDTLLIASSNSSDPPFGYNAFSNTPPNAVREVKFARGTQDWVWTVSISDVEIPNVPNATNFTTGWNAPPNARVAYTTYTFDWPQDGNINDVVREEAPPSMENSTSCFYNLWTEFPESVSKAWDSSSSSCGSAIGRECEEYIYSNLNRSEDCSRDLGELRLTEQCPGVFDGFVITSGFTFGNASAPADETSFEKGDVVSYTVSDLAAPGNSTALEHAEGRLHMVVMSNSQGTQVLCNRVAESAAMRQVGVSLFSVGVAVLMVIGLQ